MSSAKRIGVVGTPGGWSSERLATAVEKQTGFRLLVDPSRIIADLHLGRVWHDGTDLCQLDGLLLKKAGPAYSPELLDRLDLLRFVESRGVQVLSRPGRILRLLDRLACTVTLRANGIPMPPTVVSSRAELIAEAIRGWGTAVLKPMYSTKARGMILAHGHDPELIDRIEAFRAAGNPMVYAQKKLERLDRDMGLLFLGGEFVAAFARVRSVGSWNTTTVNGGRYAPAQLEPDVVELARRAQEPFGLDVTTVDVAMTVEGPVVFEVSAFGGYRGLWEAQGIDVAERFAEYALARL